MNLLKKVWKRFLVGKSPGRVFKLDGKTYIVNKTFSDLSVSRSTKKDFLKGILHYITDPLFVFINTVTFVVAIIMVSGGAPFITSLNVFGTFLVVANLLLPFVFSGMESVGRLSIFLSKPPLMIYEYANKKSEDLIKIMPHLSNDEVAKMIDHVIELEEIDELINKTEALLNKEDKSVFNNELREELQSLKIRQKEIKSVRFDRSRSIHDEDTLKVLQEISHYNKTNSYVSRTNELTNDFNLKEVQVEVPEMIKIKK